MVSPLTRRIRLESCPEPDWTDATTASVHDPLWFLARQWQLGEFQGENATTPVIVELVVTERPVEHASRGEAPKSVPAEAIIESERDDWWTMGRRVRAGESVDGTDGIVLPDDDALRIIDPPPPYGALSGRWDGRALWRKRVALDIQVEAFGPVSPPELASAWNDSELVYQQDALFHAAKLEFDVVRHRGGRVDWYTVDARDAAGALPAAVEYPAVRLLPVRLNYPGMPPLGIWEIESAETDIGATPPDSAHSPTAIMTALYFSHRDEWFEIPVRGLAGTVLSIGAVTVYDSFGNPYSSADHSGLQPPARGPAGESAWSLFHTVGLDEHDLLLWNIAELPLMSDPVERVQLGIDDGSNLLWALERRIDARDMRAGKTETESVPMTPPTPPGDLTEATAYDYVPGEGAETHWIPYSLDADSRPLVFVQRRLVDLSVDPPQPMPLPAAEVLKSAPNTVHRVVAATVPSGGMEVERRWLLARDLDGLPVLWMQRQRRPLLAPPARQLRFDVAEPSSITPAG